MKRTDERIREFWIANGLIVAVSIFYLLCSAMNMINGKNYAMLHLIMEFFFVTTTFSIAIQSWMIFPHTLSNYRLWLGAFFFSSGILEMFHALTYDGMPFYLDGSSVYRATWFYMIARLTEAFSLYVIVTLDEKEASPHKRWVAYGVALLYSLMWVAVLFAPSKLLPELVINGVGTTALKNNLQYLAIALQFLAVCFIIERYKEKTPFYAMLLVASAYLIIGDLLFISYVQVDDMINFLGHLFQLTGFYFLLRALYYNSVDLPFQKQKEAEEFLYSIASNLGEGVLVNDSSGTITFMNPEAERLLRWPKEELLGKKVETIIGVEVSDAPDLMHWIHDERPATQDTEELCIRRDGSCFPISYVATPLVSGDKAVGTITVFRDITRQRKDQELIRYLAYYDELTGLPNKRYFHEKMAEKMRNDPDTQSAVLMIDIERFRQINESLGHEFGDLVLVAVGERFRGVLTPDMVLSRMGGDEYTLFLSSVEGTDEIEKICMELSKSLQEPIQVRHLSLNVMIKIGIAKYPQDGQDEGTLIRLANIAMKEANKRARRYEFYHASMSEKSLERLELENDLYKALNKEELRVVYQPQVDLKTGQIVALEALLRWEHPTKGIISPGQFIPVAEETGLIIPIGEWVLRTACRQLQRWYAHGFPPIRMAVNLSTRQFYHQNLTHMVQGILWETGISPSLLELEITESMAMNMSHTMATLKALKRLGVLISVDDFGTGYSSLNYLKQLPIDRLKIDQSFVRDLDEDVDDAAIVSMIISMAQHLNIEVLAEGVETLMQMRYLREHDCFQAQGFLFSPPRSSDAITRSFFDMQKKAEEYTLL